VHADTVETLQPAVRSIIGAGEVLGVLADDTRFRVLYALSRSELCVCEVAAIIESTTAVASYHLRLLYRAGLATYRREGKLVYYDLGDPDVRSLVEAVLTYVHKDDAL
jgi:DNA-binding transcriptional ArsR family regulator